MSLSYGPESRCQEEIPVLVTFAAPGKTCQKCRRLVNYSAVEKRRSAAVPAAVEWGALAHFAGSGKIARASLLPEHE
jgi:hypothetical protein